MAEATGSALMSASEAAKFLGICQRTLWALKAGGEIPHVRIGRRVLYSRASLTRWIEQQETASV